MALSIAPCQLRRGWYPFKGSSFSPTAMNDIDAHTLTPTAIRAASTQTDRTSTLRPARRAVPHGSVTSNALAYNRPCFQRIPKALLPRSGTASTENIPPMTAITRNNSPARTLIANSSGFTRARINPIASTGSPLDLSSNHICARVADEVGHGNRNRLTSHSGDPAPDIQGTASGASPRRCRATPATVTTNDTSPSAT